MPNRYQGYYGNELEDIEDDDSQEDLTPYDEIHPRPHLEQEEVEVDYDPKSKSVYEQIAKKYSPAEEVDYGSEPLYQQYEKDREELGKLRQAKEESDQVTNLARAFSHAARGPLTPLSAEGTFDAIQKSQGEALKSREGEINQRNKVIQAIEGRRARERIAKQIADSRSNEKKERSIAAQNDKAERRLNQDIRTVESVFRNPAITKEVIKLNASRSVQALIKEIESGKLKGSKNISKQLTNLIQVIELASPGGVADREAAGINTLYSKAKELMGYLSSKPTETIPKDYLSQLKTEGKTLGQRAYKNYEALTNASLAGTEGKVKELGMKRQKEMFDQNADLFSEENQNENEVPDTHKKFLKKKVRINGSVVNVGPNGEIL